MEAREVTAALVRLAPLVTEYEGDEKRNVVVTYESGHFVLSGEIFRTPTEQTMADHLKSMLGPATE